MADQIDSIALHEAARARYLNYALSVITSRALPDVRDGMKPVQRRILYAMFHNLRLTADAKHRKSAAVVGEVMAKYHPHGDQSIYDAMVRMAQPFSLRYTLVDGQGNFGSLDGDRAAAMRYTEAKLTALAEPMLDELRKKTVPLRPNYDGQHFEPVVLPSQLPGLLLNGAMGIAVGMATSIPPHNLRELTRALVRMIESPEVDTTELMRYVKGPDFPTGGKMLNDPEELHTIYETGSGTIKLVGEYFVEQEDPKEPRRLVIRSLPFNVNKASLVEKIAEHIRQGAIPQIEDVRDESTEEIRVVMDLAKGASARAAMAFLYKNTDLQSRFHVNMTCLIPAPGTELSVEQPMVPARVGLVEMLRHFLDFRFELLTRRLRFDLDQLEARIHLLEAFEIIFGALDEAIRIIRTSDGRQDSRDKLMARFGLDEQQVEAILETKLYRLARLEIEAVRAELAEKREAAHKLRALLASEPARWELLKDELKELSRRFGDGRRTGLGSPDDELEYSEEDYIVREDAVAVITRGGWVKRQRSYSDITKLRVRDNDEVGWVFRTMTHQTIVFFTNAGRAYTMRAESLPQTAGYGEPIQAHFDFDDGEQLVGVIGMDPRCAPGVGAEIWEQVEEGDDPTPPEFHMLALTRDGNAVRFTLEPFAEPSTRAGRFYIKLKDQAADGNPDGVVGVEPSTGEENVCLVSHLSRALIFPSRDIAVVKGRGRGVTALTLEGRDAVKAFCLTTNRLEGLEVETNRGRREIIRATKYPITRRGRKGRPIVLRGFIAAVHRAPVEIQPPGTEAAPARERAHESEPPQPEALAPEADVSFDESSEQDARAMAMAMAAIDSAREAEVVYDDDEDDEGDDDEDQMTLFD